MRIERSPLLPLFFLGLLSVLASCAPVEGDRSSLPTEPESSVSEPFQELLTDASAHPPRLIPELSLVSGTENFVSSTNSLTEGSLPSVSVAASNVPLPVPVPPAPGVIETMPIPNPVRSVVEPAEQTVPAVTPQPSPAASASPSAPSPQLQVPPAAQIPQAAVVQPVPSEVPTSARLAESVQVTGIVQVGNSVSAIVQLPNGQGSRYVRAGDALANGILVSRIEMTDDAPRVVFVQDGIEIIRTVGSR